MKTLLLHICALLALAASAAAKVIGIENFDYPNGSIAGQNGGAFWDFQNVTAPAGHDGTPSTWDNVVGAPVVESGRLLTPDQSAKREHNGPASGLGTEEESGSVVDGRVNQAVYYRVTVTTGSGVPAFFGVSAYDFDTERIFFGRRTGQSFFGIETFNGFGAIDSSVSAVATNATTTLVAKVDYVTNRLRLYVNPNFSAAEPATASAELLNYTSTNWSAAVRLGSGAGQAVLTIDASGLPLSPRSTRNACRACSRLIPAAFA